MTFASLPQEQLVKNLIATAAVIRNFRKILEIVKWGSVKGILHAAQKMKKSLMENFIFCAVSGELQEQIPIRQNIWRL